MDEENPPEDRQDDPHEKGLRNKINDTEGARQSQQNAKLLFFGFFGVHVSAMLSHGVMCRSLPDTLERKNKKAGIASCLLISSASCRNITPSFGESEQDPANPILEEQYSSVPVWELQSQANHRNKYC
jgi:hypothetical protein